MKDNLKNRLRRKLIEKLRPGRTEEELLSIINAADAIVSDEQRDQMEQMVEFQDTRVREVMIPRSEITAVDAGVTLGEAERTMVDAGVTRLPVIDGDLDKVLGFIHVWDLFSARVKGESPALAELIRPCPNVSELERVSGLLTEMREGSHIAIVLDEFGGTAGLVTLSDLLGEIVGDIEEGGDASDNGDYHRTDSGGLEVMARMHVEDFEELVGKEMPEGDFDTVGGLIVTQLGRIPLRGEQIRVAGLDIHVQEADPRRVIKVLIKPRTETQTETDRAED